ncbi:MAG: hypothetical protein J7L23_03610 [Candidatus Diapherotrites archaeon]|nr:hypothetical protein [Candidatus Diapherotrites archaeon]
MVRYRAPTEEERELLVKHFGEEIGNKPRAFDHHIRAARALEEKLKSMPKEELLNRISNYTAIQRAVSTIMERKRKIYKEKSEEDIAPFKEVTNFFSFEKAKLEMEALRKGIGTNEIDGAYKNIPQEKIDNIRLRLDSVITKRPGKLGRFINEFLEHLEPHRVDEALDMLELNRKKA